ncbi:MAG: hypothetical protein U9O82_13255 [Thermodesulfobacteriota bacterium]|nr:hypothetical protein [Thermodesulfobacteriota bacterium]
MSYGFRALRGMEKVKARLDIENPSSRVFLFGCKKGKPNPGKQLKKINLQPIHLSSQGYDNVMQ